MANSDAAQYVLRYNEITGTLEFGTGNNWTPLVLSNAAGITRLTGDVTAGPGSGSQVATIALTPAVQVQSTTQFDTTSTTYVDTGVDGTFALSKATHKVKISLSGQCFTNNSNTTDPHITIYVDGANIAPGGDELVIWNPGSVASSNGPTPYTILYSPGNTASHTYSVMLRSDDGGDVAFVAGGIPATLILEEVI